MNEIHLKPTAQRLLDYMTAHGGITGREAVTECGVCDYRKRISEMRQAGIPIFGVYMSDVNKFGEPVRFKKYYVGQTQHN